MSKHTTVRVLLLFLLLATFTIGCNNLNGSVSTNEVFFYSDEEFSKAYISFSDQLFDMGISPATNYEDFVSGYEVNASIPLQSYVSLMIEQEIVVARNSSEVIPENVDNLYMEMKNAMEAGELSEEDSQIVVAYGEFLKFVANRELNVALSYATFAETYKLYNCENVQEYIENVLNIKIQ